MQAADGFITLDKWMTVYYFEAMFSYKEKKNTARSTGIIPKAESRVRCKMLPI